MDASEALKNHLTDLARAAVARGETRYSRFLDPAEALLARHAAKEAGVSLELCGGYEEAERCVAAFFAGARDGNVPILRLVIDWSAKCEGPAHRDILGALTGTGISRELTGDILVGKDSAQLFILDSAESYLTANLESAGRTRVSLRRAKEGEALAEPGGAEIRVTAASERLDALIAAVWHLSRDEAQSLVRRELVKRNHVPCLKAEARLGAGDLVSVRGYGRFRLLAEMEPTRKGRLAARLFLYGGNRNA